MSSDYLFPQPTFRSGVASLANLSGTILYNSSATAEEADMLAAMSDWAAVGDDMRKALQQHGE